MQTQTVKPFVISKALVFEGYQKVKAKGGGPGVDGQSIHAFEEKLKDNLFKLWNRMSSGTYFPLPVRAVEIPKKEKGTRTLGIPTVSDRIAQTTVSKALEPNVEPMFHADSYAYRPGKSALDAVAKCRERCWKYDWVIDLDIKSFFDTVPHDQILELVSKHTNERWVLLYVERWLKAPLQRQDGTLTARDRGTPQGSAISPLLVNIFMHYAFDSWMEEEFPYLPFERYSDDVIVHAKTKRQASYVKAMITSRLESYGLELHPEKTKIVYCKDDRRKGDHEHIAFDFCGYTFRPRRAKNSKDKSVFTRFLPAIANSSAKKIKANMKAWRFKQQGGTDLAKLAMKINPIVSGWINFYGKFFPSRLVQVLNHLNLLLVKWAQRKYKRLKTSKSRAWLWLAAVARREPQLFAHWYFGASPAGWATRAG